MNRSRFARHRRPKRLTASRYRVLATLAGYIEENGHGPSVRELAARLGVSAHSSVHFHLDCLQHDGFLFHRPGRARSWHLTPKAADLLGEGGLARAS